MRVGWAPGVDLWKTLIASMKSNIIDLTQPKKLPKILYGRLNEMNCLFQEQDYLEDLIDNSSVRALIKEVNEFCIPHKIIGVHYTRALPERIKEQGLILRSGNEIRKNLLQDWLSFFTEDQLCRMKQAWETSFTDEQEKIRDKRIWFNFTEDALNCDLAENLLAYYGGEQVYYALESDILEKLQKIGTPMVVRCALNPQNIEHYDDNPWGKILLSAYHCKVNKNAEIYDVDAFQKLPVKPEEIIEQRILQ